MEFISGPMELVIILIIVAMLFGVGRLPEVFGAVGRGLREFRREVAAGENTTNVPVAKAENNTETSQVTEKQDQ